MDLLKRAFQASIKEYKTVWTASPRLDPETGLSRYHPNGLGIPPETESDHFDTVLLPYASKHGVTLDEFKQLYNDGKIKEPKLDEFFFMTVALENLDTTLHIGLRAYVPTWPLLT